VIRFFVEGRPRTTQTGSVMQYGRRLIPERRNETWIAFCRLVAMQHRPAQPLVGPLRLRLTFFVPKPTSRAALKKLALVPMGGADVDNMAKGVADAFQGVLYEDDKQAFSKEFLKLWAEDGWRAGVLVEVEPVIVAPSYPAALE
jgi:Holliday junction resolvase RusA-like endonuclease